MESKPQAAASRMIRRSRHCGQGSVPGRVRSLTLWEKIDGFAANEARRRPEARPRGPESPIAGEASGRTMPTTRFGTLPSGHGIAVAERAPNNTDHNPSGYFHPRSSAAIVAFSGALQVGQRSVKDTNLWRQDQDPAADSPLFVRLGEWSG